MFVDVVWEGLGAVRSSTFVVHRVGWFELRQEFV